MRREQGIYLETTTMLVFKAAKIRDAFSIRCNLCILAVVQENIWDEFTRVKISFIKE